MVSRIANAFIWGWLDLQTISLLLFTAKFALIETHKAIQRQLVLGVYPSDFLPFSPFFKTFFFFSFMLSSTQKVASSFIYGIFLVFPLIRQKEGTQKTLIFNRQLGLTWTSPEIQNFQLFTFFTFRASHRAYASIQRSSKLYLRLCLGLLNGLIIQVVQRRRQSVVCAWGFCWTLRESWRISFAGKIAILTNAVYCIMHELRCIEVYLLYI